MIKINADELNKFSVELIKLSNEAEEDVKKVVKNSAFNIQKNAISNLTKNKRFLYWKGAKHPVKQVNHPGSKAKPFLIPAFNQEKDQFLEKLKEVISW